MKKFLAAILVLLLLLTSLFLWKGGHHALYLAGAVDISALHWELSADDFSLTADTFLTRQGDEPVFGGELGGFGFYLKDDVLYTKAGLAYSLPEDYEAPIKRLLTGAVLYGRLTKTGGLYRFHMDTKDLKADVTLTEDLKTITLSCESPVSLNAAATVSENTPVLPRAVRDAMVYAEMVPPASVMNPLECARKAASRLFPLSADLTLSMDCGILELSETLGFQMDKEAAELERSGVIIEMALPGEMQEIPPEALGLLLLHSGEFQQDGERAQFTVKLSPETTEALITQLVPQTADLGVEYGESKAVFTIERDQLTNVTMTAGGSVPFLVTTIPLSFSANLDIR